MRPALFLYFTAVALLLVGIMYLAQNPDYFDLVTFQSANEETQKEAIEIHVPSQSRGNKKDESDCLFGFGFLTDLIKINKPDNKSAELGLLPFKRPFTGAIRQGTLCADSMDAIEGDTVGISPCHGHGRNQEWTFTETKQIRNKGSDTLCLSWDKQVYGKRKVLFFQTCTKNNIKQKWQYDNTRKQIMPTVNPRLCVSSKQSVLVLARCDTSSKYQRWSVLLTEILSLELQGVN